MWIGGCGDGCALVPALLSILSHSTFASTLGPPSIHGIHQEEGSRLTHAEKFRLVGSHNEARLAKESSSS